MITEAYEIYGTTAPGPLIVTCEHATNRVPKPLRTIFEDRGWLATHWGWDIGARTVARELVRQSQSIGIFSRFSRLICDPNRSPDDETWVRTQVEGYPLTFNRALDKAERQRRQRLYHEPYHACIDRTLSERLKLGGDVLLFSVHSFTPIFGVDERWMELGILYDEHEPVAHRFADELRADGFKTALNEPYSGRKGLIWAAHRHGTAHGVIYLELEVRQDLIRTPTRARAIGRRIARALERLHIRETRRP